MECPFCAEKVKDEALVCKHCSRDLRVVRPVLREIDGIVADIEKIRREFDNVARASTGGVILSDRSRFTASATFWSRRSCWSRRMSS